MANIFIDRAVARARAAGVCLGLLVAGCASGQNTAAQDRVWAAYAVCRQMHGGGWATLDRVDSDGRRWWWSARTDSTVAVNVLNPCMQRELAKQPQ